MKMTGFVLTCSCGGAVKRVLRDNYFYVLTERQTIIFRGVCSECGEGVTVEHMLDYLRLMCPTSSKPT